MGAIAMLKGPMEFVSTRLTSTELPFTVLYGVALLGTLYGAGLFPPALSVSPACPPAYMHQGFEPAAAQPRSQQPD